MKYECLRCGYITKFKSSFLDHLNRKNICEPILEPISIDEVKKYYGLPNSSDSTQTAPKIYTYVSFVINLLLERPGCRNT